MIRVFDLLQFVSNYFHFDALCPTAHISLKSAISGSLSQLKHAQKNHIGMSIIYVTERKTVSYRKPQEGTRSLSVRL